MAIRRRGLQLPGKFVEPRGYRYSPAEFPQPMAQQIFQPRHRQLAQDDEPYRIAFTGPSPIQFSKLVQ